MNNSKEQSYKYVIAELEGFYKKYNNTTYKLCESAKMASIVSLLKNNIEGLFFVGFYIVVDVVNLEGESTGEKYLEIGPYQSTILATPRIAYNKGQCGSTWASKQTQIVDDVSECKNYIACDPDTKSEIVVPVFDQQGEVISVLDIDATSVAYFTDVDKYYLEEIVKFVKI